MKLSTLRTFAVAASMCMASAVSAQTLYLSTISGTDVARYDNKTLDVKASRQVFNGWNTICLPFSMTQSQVESLFGTDCVLEELVGIENVGSNIQLNFQACNSEGIKANKPYILHYNGVAENKFIDLEGVRIKDAAASVSFTDDFGVKVSFCGAKKQMQSGDLYGIPFPPAPAAKPPPAPACRTTSARSPAQSPTPPHPPPQSPAAQPDTPAPPEIPISAAPVSCNHYTRNPICSQRAARKKKIDFFLHVMQDTDKDST